MGLTASLNIGRTALTAYQAALAVVGNNIANAATPGYSRVSPTLSAITGAGYAGGQIGGGVGLTAISRNINESLQARLRLATSDRESAAMQQSSLDRLEGVFDPLGDNNLGSLLDAFFAAWGNLQNNPENLATRGIVVNSANALAEKIRGIRGEIIQQRSELNTEIAGATRQADEIAAGIADLNTRITAAEAGSGSVAAALRDQRDQLLGQLSELFNVTVREQPSGTVNVYLGNEAIVQGGQSFGLTTTTETNAAGLPIAVVRLRINDAVLTPTTGRVAGLIAARDTSLAQQGESLDSLAAAIVREVNNIHGSGRGLEGFSTHTSLTAVLDPAAVLSAADNSVAFLPHTGSFFIDVQDAATGAVTRTQMDIDLDGIGVDSTLNSVAADINANVAGVTATVLADGRLQLTADSGQTFSFADDTSGFLAAMGLNAFFSGTSSADIAVNPAVSANPNLLAAARSTASGDGSNATALAALQDQTVGGLGGATLGEYYSTAMANLAVSSSSARSAYESNATIFDSLTAQRESLSGVNLDEEAIALVSYQRAYEGAARYISVVNEMMQVLLSLVQVTA